MKKRQSRLSSNVEDVRNVSKIKGAKTLENKRLRSKTKISNNSAPVDVIDAMRRVTKNPGFRGEREAKMSLRNSQRFQELGLDPKPKPLMKNKKIKKGSRISG